MQKLIKDTAIGLAGAFYERERSDRFRRAFPTVQHYLNGYQVINAEGAMKRINRGWMHHVVLARRVLVEMLNQPEGRVTPHMKEEIMAAIVADRGASERFGKRVHQKMSKDDYGEKSVAAPAG